MRSIKAATIVVFLCAVHLGGCGSKKAEVKDVPDAGEVFDAWDAEPQEEAVDLKAEEEAEPTDAWGEELEEAGEIEAAVDQVTEEEEEEEGEVYVEAEEDVDAEGDVIFPDVQQDAGEVVQPEATIPAEGKLILPAGLKPQDFEVGNQFGTTAPDEQGNFTIPVLEQGITITVAVPKDWTDEENAFIAITSIVPKEDQPDPKPSLIVDSYSTAKALIYMSPFFLSPNPFIAESVMNASDGVPEVTDLSNFIYLNYPSTPYPFENGEFTDFYFAAIEKVSANLPEMLLPPVGGKVLNGNPWIGANHLDHVYQVEPTYKSSAPDKITMKTVPGVPLDSLLTMQEVDVFAEHKKWSASGA
ncbi:MAG: hypothetical protein FJ088_03935, partial [Deltaproteobacteria bacterium]|nr:hypothetical protein [Deltaproteobacteria bacterium]